MEQNLLSKLVAFIKASYKERLKQTLSGFGLVGCGVYPLFFNPIPPELLHTWIGAWAWVTKNRTTNGTQKRPKKDDRAA
jgi:hypothetical protein